MLLFSTSVGCANLIDVNMLIIQIPIFKILSTIGNGFGTVGRAVVSDTREPQSQLLFLLSTLPIVKTKLKKKEAMNEAIIKCFGQKVCYHWSPQ